MTIKTYDLHLMIFIYKGCGACGNYCGFIYMELFTNKR